MPSIFEGSDFEYEEGTLIGTDITLDDVKGRDRRKFAEMGVTALASHLGVDESELAIARITDPNADENNQTVREYIYPLPSCDQEVKKLDPDTTITVNRNEFNINPSDGRPVDPELIIPSTI